MLVITWMILLIGRQLVQSLKEKKDFQAKTMENPEVPDKKELTKGEPLNLVIMIIILIFLMIVVHKKVGFEMEGTEEDYPAIIMAAVPLGVLALIIIWNIFMYARGKEKKRRWGLKSERNELSKKDLKKIDLQRKLHHFIAMLLIFLILIIGDRVLKANAEDELYAEFIESFWGSINGLNFIDRILVREDNVPMAKSIILLWMYGETLVLVIFEITRLSNSVHFPFHKQVQATMRYKEIDTFAALSHYALGYLFAAICLPPILFIASMCLITFADPVASTVGINFGTKIFPERFSWNGKSWEGLIGGTIVAFFTMFWFVGWIYALVGALTFGIIDLITPKPVKLSDNMFMPVLVTFAFMILSAAGIPCVNYFGFA